MSKKRKSPPAKKGSSSTVAIRQSQQYNFKTSIEAWGIVNQRLPNPDVILRKRGYGDISIYRDLYADAHLAAAIESREAATLSYSWEITRGSCPKRTFDKLKDWYDNVLKPKNSIEDLTLEELVDNILDVIFWGYQPAELIWDYYEGLWVPVEVIPLPPEWFHFFVEKDGRPRIRFISTENMVDGTPPEPYSLICPRLKPSYSNPYGRGVAPRCFWPIVFKKAGIEFWLSFMERFGTPWVKGSSTTNLESTDKSAFATDLRTLVRDAVVVVSGDRDVELLETKNQAKTSEGFQKLCDFFDTQMTKTILGHTLATDASDKSSYAATRGALTVRQDLGLSDKNLIRSTFNDLIMLIYKRNGLLSQDRPQVQPFIEDAVDTDRASRDESLSRAGVRFKKSYFVRTYKFRDDEIEEAEPEGLQATGFGKPPKGPISVIPGGKKAAAEEE